MASDASKGATKKRISSTALEEDASVSLVVPAGKRKDVPVYVERTKGLKSYTIWNNKGGVGKTTLCFQLSTLYATQHPDETVVVIDFCPQANLSVMMLGGGVAGQERVEEICAADLREAENTSGFSYLYKADRSVVMRDTVDLSPLLVKPSEVNKRIPKNLHLLPGSQNLSIIDVRLASTSSQHQIMVNQQKCWEHIHTSLRRSLVKLQKDWKRPVCVFIDTNPSFAVFTAIAVCASDSLIIPLKQDQMSKFAMESMMSLIYGPCPLRISFSSQAEDVRLPLPRVFMAITNQTDYGQSEGVVAAMDESARESLKKVYKSAPHRFFHNHVKGDDFSSVHMGEVGDLRMQGVVGAASGIPVCAVTNEECNVVGGIRIKHGAGTLYSAMFQLMGISKKL